LRLNKSDKPIVIILNGPSSAGKSLISYFFQEMLDTPFLHIGIDTMINMMPNKMNNWEGQKAEEGFWWKEEVDLEGRSASSIQMGNYAIKINETYKDIVNTLVLNGHNVIVDEVTFGQEGLNAWKTKLSNCYIFFVGVTANLDVLENREKERGDRKIGSARHQFYHVHKNATYDLFIDTSTKKPEQCASQIVNLINAALV
jgi:chloramphenicol 3-O phosphotransferase